MEDAAVPLCKPMELTPDAKCFSYATPSLDFVEMKTMVEGRVVDVHRLEVQKSTDGMFIVKFYGPPCGE